MPLALLAAFVVCAQVQQVTMIGPAAQREADRFFSENAPQPVHPLARRALATYVEASRAYRRGDFRHCQDTLDELWRDFPIGSPLWRQVDEIGKTISLGNPVCYPTLLMLDEASRWKNDPASKTVKATPILFGIVLFGHSKGIQPRNRAELLAGEGVSAYHNLDPLLLADNYQRLRSTLWLFQEYVLAITKGRARLDLDFNYLPEDVVPVETVNRKVPTGYTAFAAPVQASLEEMMRSVKSRIKSQPDWWWAIVPSHVPDQYPDFKTTEFITGGMGGGPTPQSPMFIIDDKWMVRRPPHLGQGTYAPLEIEAYLPYWLSHEFYHHLYQRFPEFGLEKTPHSWHNHKNWPTDFQGMYEPDYYRESLHRRLQPKGDPPLNIRLRYAPPPRDLLAKVDLRDLLGTYRLFPITDNWHIGEIAYAGDDDNGAPILKWTNKAGVSWRLFPKLEEGVLMTDDANPYIKLPSIEAKRFTLALARDVDGRYTNRVAGYSFQGEMFVKDR